MYSKKPVIIKGNTANTINDRRNHIAAAARNSNTDNNIDDRIAKFNAVNALSGKKVFRIPLKCLVDIGLANLPTAFNVKFVFNLQQTLAKLFESRKNLPNTAAGAAAALPTAEPDANVYFHAIPYLQYEQIKLNDTFNKYIAKAIQSKRVLRTGIKPTPYQKSYEINVGSSSMLLNLREQTNNFHLLKYP